MKIGFLSQSSDVGRLSALSSTPTWNMSYKQWRRTRRGTHFTFLKIGNISLCRKICFSYELLSPSNMMCSASSFIMSLLPFVVFSANDTIWFSDVYRRPSIKTVYEPMPDDRPRCSSASACPLSSLLLRIPSSRDRLCLSGQRLRTSFHSRDIFMLNVGKI